MLRTTPAAMAGAAETHPRLLQGVTDRFHGHGILGVTFTDGDVLAFRRLPVSSIGPPYTSVWHRDPTGAWSLYANASPDRTCARYFDAGFSRVVETGIEIEWTGGRGLAVTVPEHGIDWAVRVESGLGSRLAGLLLRIAPLRNASPDANPITHAMAASLLGGGPLSLAGRTPNGHTFAHRPRRLWRVSASAATVAGRDLGPLAPRPQPVAVGDLAIPCPGLFTIGDWVFRA